MPGVTVSFRLWTLLNRKAGVLPRSNCRLLLRRHGQALLLRRHRCLLLCCQDLALLLGRHCPLLCLEGLTLLLGCYCRLLLRRQDLAALLGRHCRPLLCLEGLALLLGYYRRLLLRLQSPMSSRFLVRVPRQLQCSALRLGLGQTLKFKDALPALQIAAFRSLPFQRAMVAAGERNVDRQRNVDWRWHIHFGRTIAGRGPRHGDGRGVHRNRRLRHAACSLA
jgi:hypothetical protein